MKPRKLLIKAMNAPQNLRFAALCRLAEAFGYTLDRISGSHHLFFHPKAMRPDNGLCHPRRADVIISFSIQRQCARSTSRRWAARPSLIK